MKLFENEHILVTLADEISLKNERLPIPMFKHRYQRYFGFTQ